jgi:hypothetical protein
MLFSMTEAGAREDVSIEPARTEAGAATVEETLAFTEAGGHLPLFLLAAEHSFLAGALTFLL